MRKIEKIHITTISIRVPKEMANDLKLICLQLGVARGKSLTLSELVREMLIPLCPEEKRKGYFK